MSKNCKLIPPTLPQPSLRLELGTRMTSMIALGLLHLETSDVTSKFFGQLVDGYLQVVPDMFKPAVADAWKNLVDGCQQVLGLQEEQAIRKVLTPSLAALAQVIGNWPEGLAKIPEHERQRFFFHLATRETRAKLSGGMESRLLAGEAEADFDRRWDMWKDRTHAAREHRRRVFLAEIAEYGFIAAQTGTWHWKEQRQQTPE